MKWVLLVFVASIALAGLEIYRLGSFAGLVVGIILLPALAALQLMVARLVLPSTENDSH